MNKNLSLNEQINILDQHKERLIGWIFSNNFVGYDPYDGMNHKFTMAKEFSYLNFLSIYFNYYSAINFRRILSISKTFDNKGNSLIAKYLIKSDFEKYRRIINHVLHKISRKTLKAYSGYHSWNSHDFPIEYSNFEYQSKTTPGIIGSVFVGDAFIEYYKKSPSKVIKNILIDIKSFLIEKLLVQEPLPFFKYRPTSSDSTIVFNSSIIAARFIVQVNTILGEKAGLDIADNVVQTVISHQNNDGSWHYSRNNSTGDYKQLIDYHQGFIIDSLVILSQLSESSKIEQALGKSLYFYRKKLFTDDGISIFRLNKSNIIDIHSQAQGIITFSNSYKINDSFLEFAVKIAIWTINNMQDKKGYFYFQKKGLYVNKIAYMRWNQAWMLEALGVLISNLRKAGGK